jgi:glycosyltransferase involved in cell wall biosynthesis
MEKSSLSIIITGQKSVKNIEALLEEVKKLNCLEIIMLLRDSNDETVKIATRLGAQVLRYESDILIHKMRVFGAQLAKGNVLLFLDTKCEIKVADLKPLVSIVRNSKADLAISTYANAPPGTLNIETVEYILNITANRRDLKCGSLYNAPFVISREALMLIETDSLAIPPLAKFKAIRKGLKIEVFRFSTIDSNENTYDFENEILIEECLLALHYWMRRIGERCGYTNLGRRLDILKEQNDGGRPFHTGVTAIIAASNEEETIGAIIKSAFNAGASQVIVVENGSTDHTLEISKKAGAQVVSFPYRIGHDTGRAVGVLNFPSSHYLFLDGDMIISSSDLKSLITAVTRDGVDVALNNLSYLINNRSWDEVTWSKYFLNHAMGRKDLDVNTLTAIPHAISGKAMKLIGPENLAIPTVATVKAVMAGLNVKAIKEIDVISKNKVRNQLHKSSRGNLIEQLIVGDMCQGLFELMLLKYGSNK